MIVFYVGAFVFILVVFFGVKFGERFYKKAFKKKLIKQCSYGSSKMAKALASASDYDSLKQLFTPDMSFQDRYFASVSSSRIYEKDVLEQWVNDEPNSADALLCYGAKLVQWSWDARGYGMGSSVSRKQWESFAKCLDKTRAVLTQCAEAMPSDPTPWAYLVMVSTWSSDHPDDRAYYFKQATARDPYNWPAHMHMIIALSEKWGGDNKEMIAFAESASKNAPEGNDLAAISIKAYIENWKYLGMFEEDPEGAQAFLDSKLIQEKAAVAYERSLGSPKHVETSMSVFVRYNTSAWFWAVKDKLHLKRDLSILGNKIEDIHWRWAGAEGYLSDAKKFAR